MHISDNTDLSKPTTQTAFGKMVGISQPAVSDLIKRQVIYEGGALGDWLKSYCSHLREQAAGRIGNSVGDLDLVTERARLAKEQADKIAMANAVMRKEYAPVVVLSQVLADAGRQIASILETIPVNLKRRSKGLTSQDLEYLQQEIVSARNIAANINLNLDELLGPDGDTESDPSWA